MAEYVAQLEQQQDATELPEASGEAIAAEFERYLSAAGSGLDQVHRSRRLGGSTTRVEVRPVAELG